AAGMNRMSNVNLNKELAAFEQMTSSGITPSSQRIKEFVQASCAQGRLAQDRNKVILCIARILRDEEECCADTENTLRDLLVVLEATSSTKELKRIFVGG
ncbi:MAG: hypothetical protein NTY47_01210, partial [Candidatus Omnitrophica bacterium]|nr:hypothetical protein [Candidatus Omnitrophota bacterium]